MSTIFSKVNLTVLALVLALGAAVSSGLITLESQAVACDDPMSCG